jgi:Fe-S-cluster containining protein
VYPVIKDLLGDDMPEFDIENNDGVCVYLTNDNKCSIYEHRPVVCNSDKMFDLLATALNIDKSELWKAQTISCELNRGNTNFKK